MKMLKVQSGVSSATSTLSLPPWTNFQSRLKKKKITQQPKCAHFYSVPVNHGLPASCWGLVVLDLSQICTHLAHSAPLLVLPCFRKEKALHWRLVPHEWRMARGSSVPACRSDGPGLGEQEDGHSARLRARADLLRQQGR